jgi:hypothetical protein
MCNLQDREEMAGYANSLRIASIAHSKHEQDLGDDAQVPE